MPRRGHRNIKDLEVRRALQTLSLADLLDVSDDEPANVNIIVYSTITKRWELDSIGTVGAAPGHEIRYTLFAGPAIAI